MKKALILAALAACTLSCAIAQNLYDDRVDFKEDPLSDQWACTRSISNVDSVDDFTSSWSVYDDGTAGFAVYRYDVPRTALATVEGYVARSGDFVGFHFSSGRVLEYPILGGNAQYDAEAQTYDEWVRVAIDAQLQEMLLTTQDPVMVHIAAYDDIYRTLYPTMLHPYQMIWQDCDTERGILD